jgi:hypothetical protein
VVRIKTLWEIRKEGNDMKEGQKVLSIDQLFFFLPEGFTGDMSDALELLAEVYRRDDENMNMVVISSESDEPPTKDELWAQAIDEFEKAGKDFVGVLGICELKQGVFNIILP